MMSVGKAEDNANAQTQQKRAKTAADRKKKQSPG